MSFRKVVFWAHLIVGIAVGGVILTMSVTGILLAYERQIVAAAERGISAVTPASGAVPLGLDALSAKARAAFPDTPPTGFTLRRNPRAAALVNLGRERAVFFDPYTGAVLGEASKLRGFLHDVEHLHRDLLIGANGKTITGACSPAFLGLVVSGLYLWWPRKWTKAALTAIAIPSFRLRGKARNWNWHNAVGFWCALPLCVTILTGAVMSYQWANNLLYRATGNEPPTPRNAQDRHPPSNRAKGGIPTADLDRLWERAVLQVPGWKSIALRLSDGPAGPVTFMIDEGDGTPHTRSQLTLHPATGEIQRWEPYSSYNLGRKLRTWTRPVHTGEALGLTGQTVAALAALGAAVLVWTGFSMGWHRFRNRATDRNISGESAPVEPGAIEAQLALKEQSDDKE